MTDNRWESKFDDWKLRSNEDGLNLNRWRTGNGGKYGTVQYEYLVEKIGKCPCCEEDILEDDMWTEDKGTLYHFECHNYKIRDEEEEKENDRK
jgi:hypothetical protein